MGSVGRALCALLLATLGPVSGQPQPGGPPCTARALAKYSLTFTGKWSQAAFPKQYPLFRPPAQWSALLGECSGGRGRRGQVRARGARAHGLSPRPGAAHSGDYSLWRKDQYVTNGMRDFAERGEAWALMREMEAAGEQMQSLHAVFAAPAVPSGTGHTAAELEVHPRHPLVSLRGPRGAGGAEGRGTLVSRGRGT